MAGRPRIHFTPARNWMNDPNGLVFHRGRYHLFFQHNPFGADHAHMSWGHASSPDLMEWTEHPVAIPCDEHEEIYSGSIVIDEENTSGFGHSALVAVYTSHTAEREAQSLAYSVDDGMTWTKYAGNPVLDRGSQNFRDPKVFRYAGDAGDYWVMSAVEATEHRVVLYRSDDLRTWTFLSSYGPAGAVGGVWECPDLFPLLVDGDPEDVRWVLLISLNPGGIAGGSGTQYVVGRFDGVTFTPDRPVPDDLASVDWLDYGRDCYAGVTFSGLPVEERTLIAWMGNWDYARGEVPTSPWRGAMTVPRRLSLVTSGGRPRLRSLPVLPVGRAVDADGALPVAARIDLRARIDDGGSVVLTIAGDEGRASIVCTPDAMSLDRTAAGTFAPLFPGVESARLSAPDDVMELTILVDAYSVEVFAQSGVAALTDLVFVGDRRGIDVAIVDAVVESLEVSDLGGVA
ncbi:glycoside hydrolase family 32 protein [Microbacterium sp. ASV49]|uniref:Glycoside hydrolase family 32 protein n=1 Tax=Microbacterium candidum TaxID=3041922 RepID=A0ABT7MWI3_9MICO|nr:glycoside hydrolase family 32 protein [Microbacterium sp. ASV49]MDL9978814.1 glycoside hydrolase family 32 protein [Microbacterium sp. ASV49]